MRPMSRDRSPVTSCRVRSGDISHVREERPARDRGYRSRRNAVLSRSFPARVIPGVGRRDAGLARATTFALLVVDVPVLTGEDIFTVTLTAKWPVAEYVCRPITVKLPSP